MYFLVSSNQNLDERASRNQPIGVGKALGAELRKSFGPLAMDEPIMGDLLPDEQRPGKGCGGALWFFLGRG
jgi:hypothetical protein